MTGSCRRRGCSLPLISRSPEHRREDLLLDQEEQEAVYIMRKGTKRHEARGSSGTDPEYVCQNTKTMRNLSRWRKKTEIYLKIKLK